MTAKIGALLAVAAVAAATAAAAAWAKSKIEEADLDLEVADAPARVAAPAPVASVEPSSAVTAPAAATGSQDDLTTLKGLGAVTAERLAGVGVTSFAQIAAWSEEDIAAVTTQINASPGRIEREDWVGQAAAKLEG